MMKAAYLTERPEIGQVPAVLRVDDETVAAPGIGDLKNDQVLVDVKAAGVNGDDLRMQEGSMAGGIPFVQAPIPTNEKPRVIGCDFAGVVTAVGPNVDPSKLKVGDAVVGIIFQPLGHQGSWAQQILTSPYYVRRIPPPSNDNDNTKNFTFADWAALVMPAFVATAMFKDGAVVEKKDIIASDEDDTTEKEDDADAADSTTPPRPLRCLVVGASGGIGSFLVQLLAAQKPFVHVTGVCGPTNVDFVKKELGADEVFDYTKGSLTDQLAQSEISTDRFDRVFDLVGGLDLEEEAYSSLLVGNGRFVTAVGPVKYIGSARLGAWEQIKYVNHLFLWSLVRNHLIHRDQPAYCMSGPTAFDDDVFRLISEAKIRPVVDRLVPFEREPIAEAIQLVQSHRARGRIVLAIDPENCAQPVALCQGENKDHMQQKAADDDDDD